MNNERNITRTEAEQLIMDAKIRTEKTILTVLASVAATVVSLVIFKAQSQPDIPKTGWCHYDSAVVSVGCTDGHCLVCTEDHACRWMDWYTTCGDAMDRDAKQ